MIDDDFITKGYFSRGSGDEIRWHCLVDDGLWSDQFKPGRWKK